MRPSKADCCRGSFASVGELSLKFLEPLGSRLSAHFEFQYIAQQSGWFWAVVQGRIEKSDAYSTEGRRARQRLTAIFATMRKLARIQRSNFWWTGLKR
jgi:hypothetical protein